MSLALGHLWFPSIPFLSSLSPHLMSEESVFNCAPSMDESGNFIPIFEFAVKTFAGQPEAPNYPPFLSIVDGIYFKVGCGYATKTNYVRQNRLRLRY